jgi:anti-sigma B factor antagonist
MMTGGRQGVTIERVHGVTILQVRGALKLGEPVLDELRRICHDLESCRTYRLVLDLEHVPALDSTGIGVLLEAYTALHRCGGCCKLLNLAHMPAEVLDIVGLLAIFEVYQDRNSALASFERAA